MPLSRENDVAHKVIGFAIEVHRALGPGHNPEIYRTCLEYELQQSGSEYSADVIVPLNYKETGLDIHSSIDFILENCVVIILDDSPVIPDYRIMSLVKLLHETNMKLGLIINFNYSLMKNGIRRVTNNRMLENPPHPETSGQ